MPIVIAYKEREREPEVSLVLREREIMTSTALEVTMLKRQMEEMKRSYEFKISQLEKQNKNLKERLDIKERSLRSTLLMNTRLLTENKRNAY